MKKTKQIVIIFDEYCKLIFSLINTRAKHNLAYTVGT